MIPIKSQISSCSCSLLKSSIDKRGCLDFWGNKESDVLFLLSHKYNPKVESLLFKTVGSWGVMSDTCSFGYSLGCVPPGYDMENVTSQYITCKDHNIKKRVQEISPKVIIVEGFGIKTIVEQSNISFDAFSSEEAPLSSFFYSPEFDAWIFPIPPVNRWVNYSKKTKELRVLRNFPLQFCKSQIKKALSFSPRKPVSFSPKVEVVEDPNSFLESNMGKKEVSFDLETTSLKHYSGEILCATLSFDGKVGYFLDWNKIDKEVLNRFFIGKYVIGSNFKFDLEFLWYNGITNAHLGFDVNYAGHILYSDRSNGLKEQTYYYTLFGGYDNALDRFKSKYKIKNYANIPRDVMVEYAGMDAIMTFRIRDCVKSRLTDFQLKFLEETYFPVAEVVARMEMNGVLIDVDYLSQYRETLISDLRGIETRIREGVKDKVLKYNSKTREPFTITNLASTDEIKTLFLRVLGAEVVSLTDKGSEAVGEKALKAWSADQDQTIRETASLMLEHRSLSKLLSSYLSDGSKFNLSGVEEDSFKIFEVGDSEVSKNDVKKRDTTILQNIDKNNRLHSSFNLQRVNVGRFSCNNSNIQQIPIKSVPKIRPIFKASEGNYLVEVDYSGFHLRLMAMFSGDPVMCKVLSNPIPSKRDLHSETGAFVFTEYSTEEFVQRLKEGDPLEKSSLKKKRSRGKVLNFELIYGAIAETVAERDLLPPPPDGWTEDEVREYLKENSLDIRDKDFARIEKGQITQRQALYYACADSLRTKFFDKYQGVSDFIASQRERAAIDGYVESMYGFKIYLPDLRCPNCENEESHIANLKNDAVNYPIISTEANIMQRSMVKLQRFFDKERLDVKIINQVHDSLLLDMKEDLVCDSLGKSIREIMCEDRPEYRGIPLDVEAMYGKVWGSWDKDLSAPMKVWFE